MQSTRAMTSMGAKGAMTARDRSSSSYVLMLEYTTGSNRSQMFFIVIFFHFLLDKVFRKNLCKSLVIKELWLRGHPPRRNSLRLREL